MGVWEEGRRVVEGNRGGEGGRGREGGGGGGSGKMTVTRWAPESSLGAARPSGKPGAGVKSGSSARPAPPGLVRSGMGRRRRQQQGQHTSSDPGVGEGRGTGRGPGWDPSLGQPGPRGPEARRQIPSCILVRDKRRARGRGRHVKIPFGVQIFTF